MTERMPSYNQLYQQKLSKHERPTVLVRRSNGLIEAGAVQGVDTDNPNRQIVAVEGGEKSLDPTKSFTDAAQEALAAELAGEPLRNQELIDDVPLSERMGHAALRSFGVESPAVEEGKSVDTLYEGLSQSAREELKALEYLRQSQMEAHNDGDWTSSTTFKQQAFMMQQGLSQEARAYLTDVDQQRRRPRN